MGKLEDTLQETTQLGDMPRLTLGMLRRGAMQLREPGRILVTIDLDCEWVARDLPGFTPVERFLTLEKVVRKYVLDEDVQLPRWHPNAIGLTERFEVVLEKQDRQPGDPCTVTLESSDGRKQTYTVAPG